MMGTHQVQLLVAWQDRRWQSVIESVPEAVWLRERTAPGAIAAWANQELLTCAAYRGAVCFALMNADPGVEPELEPRATREQRRAYATGLLSRMSGADVLALLLEIFELMDGEEWDSDTPAAIAQVFMDRAGVRLAEPWTVEG